MTEVVWAQPSDVTRIHAGRESTRLLEHLKSKPGEWAIVKVCTQTNTRSAQMSRLKREMPGCEFVGRKIGNGLHYVYARYLGDD